MAILGQASMNNLPQPGNPVTIKRKYGDWIQGDFISYIPGSTTVWIQARSGQRVQTSLHDLYIGWVEKPESEKLACDNY